VVKRLVRPTALLLLWLERQAKFLLAAAAIAYGCWLIYPPAAFLAVGLLLLADRITD
jgi:hypothetical protein